MVLPQPPLYALPFEAEGVKKHEAAAKRKKVHRYIRYLLRRCCAQLRHLAPCRTRKPLQHLDFRRNDEHLSRAAPNWIHALGRGMGQRRQPCRWTLRRGVRKMFLRRIDVCQGKQRLQIRVHHAGKKLGGKRVHPSRLPDILRPSPLPWSGGDTSKQLHYAA